MPYRKGKRWVAYPHDPVLGKKVYAKTFDTKREAREAERAYIAARRKWHHASGSVTCGEFARAWPENYPRPKTSTNEHNRERLKVFIRDFETVKLAELDRVRAREWALRHRGNVSAVRAMFSDAKRDGLIDVNPFTDLRFPQSKGRKTAEILSETQLVALADLALEMGWGAFGREYRAMVLFAGYTAVRPGELFVLRREDLHGDFVNVERAQVKCPGGWELGPPKNGRSRTIVVPPPAREALEDVTLKAEGWLFANPKLGAPWTQTSNFYWWKSLRERFGQPRLAWYTLRHSAATLLLERGLTPWDVSIQLGHTDGGVLVQTLYGHPSHAGARSRVLAAFGSDELSGPTPISAADRQTG